MKFIRILFLFTFSYISLNAQLAREVKNIISKLPSTTKIAISIVNANTNKIVFEKNSSVAMIPASNTKLFTTAAALYLMGNHHVFDTKILTDDLNFQDDTIHGNIYIKGLGNSTFTYHDLDTLVLKMKDLGINTITGKIIADDSFFDKNYYRDDWIIDEKSNVRLPPVSALVIDRNQFIVALKSNSKIGNKLKYSIYPNANFIHVDITARVTKFRSHPRISSHFSGNKIFVTISGGLRKRRTVRRYAVNVDNPPLYFALLFKQRLLHNGIRVKGECEVGKTPENSFEIATKGILITKLIAEINKHSNNYLAECLFKSIGAYYSGEEGNSFYATQAVLTTFAKDNVIDDQTAVVDGSGISRFNTVTTSSISKLLYKIYKDKIYYSDFLNSLSIYGIDGTLEERSHNSLLTGNFRGKTGTLNGVTAVSGYLKNKNGEDFIISIIMKFKHKGMSYHKNIEDKILSEIAK